MSSQRLDNIRLQPSGRGNKLIPILLIWGVALSLLVTFVWYENGLGDAIKGFYLVPWIIFAGIAVLAPTAWLTYKGKFDPFHPLIFAAWSYVFPAFVIGGVIIAFDWVNPFFMSFIDDPKSQLPLSLVYVGVGFIGLTVGFALPIGRYIAEKCEPRLPKWDWEPNQVWIPGILLLFAGIGVNLVGFVQGIMGFQRLTEVGIFDASLYFLLTLLSEGTMLLWLAVFTTKEKRGIYYIVFALLLLMLPLRMALLGSRSSLLISIFPIAMAFQYSGRKLKWQYTAALGVILLLAVAIGVTYGTSFRNIKGSEARMDAGDYVGQIGATIDYLSNEDPEILVKNSAQALADRVENLSSLAVVVANYERLAPYEESYGLENNIINDTLTSFIPRFIWNDKPPTSDARAYSDLYFNYGENSFAISPFGDLVRNFGPIGVPLGMLLLGIYLRVIHAGLIDTPHPALWKKVAYFPLLTLVSYEAFYATIFPSIVRTVFILAVSLFLVNLIARQIRKSRAS